MNDRKTHVLLYFINFLEVYINGMFSCIIHEPMLQCVLFYGAHGRAGGHHCKEASVKLTTMESWIELYGGLVKPGHYRTPR